MASNPYGAYLESKVLTASPLQLIHLAYEGAIEAIANARVHVSEKRILERSTAITKAQQIIMELQASLDYAKGGDLSVRLGQLYDYMQRRLIEANVKQIDEPLADVQGLLTTLDEAWKEIAGAETPVTHSAATAASGASPWMTHESSVYSRAEFTF
jgi:flagellar secretion chaperone FliS